jgi:hypothetical protein
MLVVLVYGSTSRSTVDGSMYAKCAENILQEEIFSNSMRELILKILLALNVQRAKRHS